jgi:hypothetical protein
VHVPRPQERPQLSVVWETFVRAPRLLVRLKARNLPQRPARSMTLRVFGIAAGQPRRNLAEWSLAPNAGGEFDRSLAVVVGRAYSDVCVVASISTRDPECPRTGRGRHRVDAARCASRPVGVPCSSDSAQGLLSQRHLHS